MPFSSELIRANDKVSMPFSASIAAPTRRTAANTSNASVRMTPTPPVTYLRRRDLYIPSCDGPSRLVRTPRCSTLSTGGTLVGMRSIIDDIAPNGGFDESFTNIRRE